MTTQPVKLIDPAGNVLAVADVLDEGAHYGGTIDLQRTPPEIEALFREFDEIVNDQMFSFLDEIEDKIAALGSRAVFPDGRECSLRDLQVYPSTGGVSFKIHDAAKLNGTTTVRGDGDHCDPRTMRDSEPFTDPGK